MTNLPSGIFFINADISCPPGATFIGADPSSSTLTTLMTQLYIPICDVMTKAEFDARLAVDPNYATVVHLQLLRILVILPDFHDLTNRQYADVVMFYHQGLIDIEKNKFGPPGQSYELQRANMWAVLRAGHSKQVITLPFPGTAPCDACRYPFYCDRCHTFSGMKICESCGCGCQCGCTCKLTDNQGIVQNPIYAPNCDNEYHNEDFIHRK